MAQILLRDIAEAIGLLTRLPLRLTRAPRGAKAAWAYPLAGVAVGGLAAVVATLTAVLPAALSAGLALATMVIITGALHEDGLADTLDGLWGGWTKERRLEIMRDSRIGAYGVLALVFGIGLRWVALASLAESGALALALIAAAAMSRAPMVVVMASLPHARTDGLSQSTGRPDMNCTLVAVLIAALIGLLVTGGTALIILVVLALITLAVIAIARAKIGGQTGDILGASQQVSEIAILAAFAALAA